ncbi:MAG: 5'-methylthioadenosine/adenosylhomocysteine nucleosidase [Oscillospiraceae bacterium]|nr:5'-methylthioadenosine/adenosylhomocysteine nucleosidase [Oscillospiraceae bacterium]
MIGIIGAMQVEIDGLKAMLKDAAATRISGIDFVTGRLHGHEVVLAVCGVGKVFAALCAQTMILRFGVRAIINTGVAGTLCPQLGIGDVAIARQVVQHDMDTSPLGDPVGLLSGINQVYLPASSTLSNLVAQVVGEKGMNYKLGTIATGDQFLATEERKRWIHSTFDAIAGEMEGGSIGHVCYVNQIPFAVIRTISDDADGNVPNNFADFAAETARSAISITAAVLERLNDEQELD